MDALQAHDKEKVLISIGGSCGVYEPVPHKDDWYDIIFLSFDDVTEDTDTILETAMSMEQSIQCNSFISKHLDRDFVIHYSYPVTLFLQPFYL